MQRFDAWLVAAAILFDGDELHIDELTRAVVRTGLTTLGLKGRTPRQSLCPQLLKRRDVFRGTGGGYYGLQDRTIERKYDFQIVLCHVRECGAAT